ncbi:MAG: PorT family protein [Prolixibacteraceae bacterium]|nr:PorT family protein [Prolixibacteraceae bacterium]
MQNNENHIDQLFRDKLSGFEVVPSQAVWERISNSMGHQKKRRKVLFLWTMSGAASLLLAFLLGWYLSGETNHSQTLMAELEHYRMQRDLQWLQQPKIEQHLVFHFDRPGFNQFMAAAPANTITKDAKSSVEPAQQIFALHTLAAVNLEHEADFPQLAGHPGDEFFSASDLAIMAANLQAMHHETSEPNSERWAVGVSASPLYRFNQAANTNADASFDLAMNQMPSSYQTRFSGGLSVAYETGNKIDVISGVHYAEIAQDAGQVALSFLGHNWLNERADVGFATESYNNDVLPANNSNNLILNTQVGLANIELPVGASVATAKTMTALVPNATQNYDYKQMARYIEVPLLLRYHLIQNRLGLHVTGGFNSNILVDNSVRLEDENMVVASGKIEGLRPLTWSSSLGLGLNYALTDELDLNFEPMLKIQLNSLNSQAYFNTRSAAFGVFSGVSYRF